MKTLRFLLLFLFLAASLSAQNSYQPNAAKVIYVGTNFTSVSNTTTETSISGTGVGSRTIPANMLYAGKAYRITGYAVYSTPGLPGNATVRVKINSTVLDSSVATGSLLSANASNYLASFSCVLIVRTVGATGTIQPSGMIAYQLNTSTGTTATLALNNNGATSPLNTTIDNTIDATLQWSNAQSGQTVTPLSVVIEELN